MMRQCFIGYRGYAKRQTLENLDPQTTYAFRLKLQDDEEESDWSNITSVATLSKSEKSNIPACLCCMSSLSAFYCVDVVTNDFKN